MARYYSYLIECGNDVIFFKTYVTITGLTLPLNTKSVSNGTKESTSTRSNSS